MHATVVRAIGAVGYLVTSQHGQCFEEPGINSDVIVNSRRSPASAAKKSGPRYIRVLPKPPRGIAREAGEFQSRA